MLLLDDQKHLHRAERSAGVVAAKDHLGFAQMADGAQGDHLLAVDDPSFPEEQFDILQAAFHVFDRDIGQFVEAEFDVFVNDDGRDIVANRLKLDFSRFVA